MSESVFDRLSKTVWLELQSSTKLEELYRLFTNVGGTPEAIFKHIWGLSEFHNNLNIDLILPKKHEVHAEKLLEQADKYAEKRLYARALEIYNMCLMKSPFPSLDQGSNCTNVKSETLSKCYSNRSALLLELQQYEKCIDDIDRAMRYSHSNESFPVLLDRKSKCENNITLQKEKKSQINHGSSDPNHVTINTIENLDELLKQVSLVEDAIPGDKNMVTGDHGIGITISKTRDDLIFQYSNGEGPVNVQESHPNIPCFSTSLDVEFKPECGRLILATRDIKPGELLLVEGAFACLGHLEPSVLRGLYTTSHCCNCLTRCHSPVPCPTCHIVSFCSEQCRNSQTGHQIECPLLPACVALGIDEHAIQACRILGQVTFPKLIKSVPKLKQESIKNPRISHGFNKNGVYDSTDYRTIYNLESNTKEIDCFTIFLRSVKAFLLTILLLESDTFFVDETGKRIFPSVKEVMIVGSTLLGLSMSLPMNCYALYEHQAKVINPKFDNNIQNIGIGVFVTASLFNHSCNSNTARFNCGNVLNIYAKSFIPKGSEVTTSYGVSYHIDKKEERQTKLRNDYKFECRCVACSENWPLLENVPPKTVLKLHENSELLQSQLKSTLVKYYSSIKRYYLENVEDNDAERQMLQNTMSETIKFIDRYCELPTRDYFNAQKVLAQCMEKRGSKYFIVS